MALQTRTVDLKKVFQHLLGPYPWSLLGSMGELSKTNKSTQMHILEKGVEPVENVDGNLITVVDRKALVQKMRATGKTFEHFSEQLLKATFGRF